VPSYPERKGGNTVKIVTTLFSITLLSLAVTFLLYIDLSRRFTILEEENSTLSQELNITRIDRNEIMNQFIEQNESSSVESLFNLREHLAALEASNVELRGRVSDLQQQVNRIIGERDLNPLKRVVMESNSSVSRYT